MSNFSKVDPWLGKTVSQDIVYCGERRHEAMVVKEQGPLFNRNQSRDNLWDSYTFLNQRYWDQIFQMPDGDINSLKPIKEAMEQNAITGGQWTEDIKALRQRFGGHNGPLMLMEFGFGFTTMQLLEWCVKNDGYLVTVELPICPYDLLQSEQYPELYCFGVDRYSNKYQHCMTLMQNPIAQKRWIWINDEIRAFVRKIQADKALRQQLWHKEQLHFMYEDAIHDDRFHEELLFVLRPFMPPGAIFTGHDNCKTIYL